MQPGTPHDDAAFRQGLAASADTSAGGLLHRLFSVRTFGLFGELPPQALASYLSGMLIGAELRDACTGLEPDRRIAVIGSSRMTELYVEALQTLGFTAEAVAGDALFIAALHRIGQDAKLL